MTELKIMNYKQCLFYVTNGVQPIRLEKGYDGKMVFIFTKEDTYKLFPLWRKQCEEYKSKMNKT